MRSAIVLVTLGAVAPAIALPATTEGWTEVFENGESVTFPYPIGDIEWTGKLEEDGPEVTIAGLSLDHIDAKIQAEHNGLSIFDGSLNFGSNVNTTALASTTEDMLSVRQAAGEAWNCNTRFGTLKMTLINDGIGHLRSVGRCRARARQCIRTTCQQNAAIVLCNDNTYDLDIACSQISDITESLRNQCYRYDPCDNGCLPPCIPQQCPGGTISGQIFSTQKWNVIVSYCDNFSPSGQPVKML